MYVIYKVSDVGYEEVRQLNKNQIFLFFVFKNEFLTGVQSGAIKLVVFTQKLVNN